MHPRYKKFEKLLKKNKVTAYRVASDTGISTATLTNWKHGRYNPKIDKLKILSEYFGVPVDYFIE